MTVPTPVSAGPDHDILNRRTTTEQDTDGGSVAEDRSETPDLTPDDTEYSSSSRQGSSDLRHDSALQSLRDSGSQVGSLSRLDKEAIDDGDDDALLGIRQYAGENARLLALFVNGRLDISVLRKFNNLALMVSHLGHLLYSLNLRDSGERDTVRRIKVVAEKVVWIYDHMKSELQHRIDAFHHARMSLPSLERIIDTDQLLTALEIWMKRLLYVFVLPLALRFNRTLALRWIISRIPALTLFIGPLSSPVKPLPDDLVRLFRRFCVFYDTVVYHDFLRTHRHNPLPSEWDLSSYLTAIYAVTEDVANMAKDFHRKVKELRQIMVFAQWRLRRGSTYVSNTLYIDALISVVERRVKLPYERDDGGTRAMIAHSASRRLYGRVGGLSI